MSREPSTLYAQIGKVGGKVIDTVIGGIFIGVETGDEPPPAFAVVKIEKLKSSDENEYQILICTTNYEKNTEKTLSILKKLAMSFFPRVE
jgi:hypothetical protein